MVENNLILSHGGSPILNLSQDHLFTILLLLTIDAIMSLSLTCKRLRAIITCSDSLWESLCTRDWGSSFVDALKCHSEFPWIRLYKQVYVMDCVYCYKLCDPNSCLELELDFPSPRASHSLNFVSDCLVLFGGGREGGLFSFLCFFLHVFMFLSPYFMLLDYYSLGF